MEKNISILPELVRAKVKLNIKKIVDFNILE
jgi:hypothetical protein